MHPDHILLIHREHIRELAARADQLRLLRAARRPRSALSRLLTRITPRRVGLTPPRDGPSAPDGVPLARASGREVEPIVVPIMEDEIGAEDRVF